MRRIILTACLAAALVLMVSWGSRAVAAHSLDDWSQRAEIILRNMVDSVAELVRGSLDHLGSGQPGQSREGGQAKQADPTSRLANGFDAPGGETSRQVLDSLQVQAPGPMSGYSRDQFPHWRDATSNGWPAIPNDACDSRQATLYRDGAGVTVGQRCQIVSGSWSDPYTGTTLTNPGDLDIDHLVPLAEAWRSGASGWTLEQRTQFANGQLELVAVQGAANRAKGDKIPAAWKPTNVASHCLYAQRWVAIKGKWKLTVTAGEKAALNTMLDTCAA